MSSITIIQTENIQNIGTYKLHSVSYQLLLETIEGASERDSVCDNDKKETIKKEEKNVTRENRKRK